MPAYRPDIDIYNDFTFSVIYILNESVLVMWVFQMDRLCGCNWTGLFLGSWASHEMHERITKNTKIKKSVKIFTVPLVPHTKFPKLNEIHEKGDKGD